MLDPEAKPRISFSGRNSAVTQFHVLSFEGPDPYARAGGIATRVTGLTQALADAELETHLWFVGEPDSPGHETREGVQLHRWCQWISRYHPAGVYDGEEAKERDYAASLPPFLMREEFAAHLMRGGQAVVLAEEWHTVHAVLHLDWLLRSAGVRDRVAIFWNANNTFCFDRIDWNRLSHAAVITTVSRYMRHLMRPLGVDALVIPNGLSADALLSPEREVVDEFRNRLGNKTVLSKVARWDPDKNWLTAVDIIGDLKHQGANPLLLARGGVESYGTEVLQSATARGLRVVEKPLLRTGARGLLEAVERVNGADVLSLSSPVDPEARRVLFGGSAAVLANSTHEPFGLVGLETMAAGGVACTGCTGEDYAEAGRNALVLKTGDSREFLSQFHRLQTEPLKERSLRQQGRATAKRYAWPKVLHQDLLPNLQLCFQNRRACD